MKLAWFALGLVVGSAATIVLLTHPAASDVRTRFAAWDPGVQAVATATPSALPSAPRATPTPESPEASPAVILAEASPGAPDSLAVNEPATSPVAAEPALRASFAAPAETQSVALPILKTDLDRLRARALLIPVRGMDPRSVRDSFADNRGGRHHEAIDLLAPRGTPVLAVEDGRIERLFTSRLGGLTIYQFDPQAEYCYYYAHLDRYAAGLAEGMAVRRGDVIGHVGTTGNAPPGTPHLHFAIMRLGAEKHWWEGTAINAYPLWAETVSP
jgi:murein DD-endopeptidase MepM/ murein hydrolase activator NlpD